MDDVQLGVRSKLAYFCLPKEQHDFVKVAIPALTKVKSSAIAAKYKY